MLTGLWDGYKDSVRVIKSEEIKKVRHHGDKPGRLK